MMQIRSGAQTRVASPAPKVYTTRPSGPGDGGFDSDRNPYETRTASVAVEESVTSVFGLYPVGAGETATDGPCPKATAHTTSVRHTTRIVLFLLTEAVNRPEALSYNDGYNTLDQLAFVT